MIPAFDEHGYLPPGIHKASLEEIAERFAQQSELRRAQMESLRWLVDTARRVGVARIIVNGSFVADIVEPNDVDCVLLAGPGFPRDVDAEAELLAGLPFLEIQLVGQDAFEYLVQTFFATDRDGVPKGVVEVMP
jgi:hypothetical protein